MNRKHKLLELRKQALIWLDRLERYHGPNGFVRFAELQEIMRARLALFEIDAELRLLGHNFQGE